MARKGISLVALVITIIVLIILTAGVIMLAGGENGIIERAQRAVEANNQATATEKVLLEVSNIKMEVAGTGQTVSQYLYDTTVEGDSTKGEIRRAELERKEISVPVTPPEGNEIVFTVGDYLVTTDLKGNIQNTLAVATLDDIEIGDYIDYDAGTWTQEQITELQTAGLYSNTNTTGELPDFNTPYMFGGFKTGDSRNNSANGYGTNKGWIVVGKNHAIITIAHAGRPEGYHHTNEVNGAYKSEYILGGTVNSNGVSAWDYSSIIKRDWRMYENRYAVEESAHLWTYAEAYILPELRTIGSNYWLASAFGSDTLFSVYIEGDIHNNTSSCYGVRPVVSLKSNIQVAGSEGEKDANNPWQIVGLGE